MNFNRQNNNILTSWWWTIDKISLLVIIVIMAFGAIMVTTASPAVAERIGLESSFFIKRQLIFLVIALIVMLFFSFSQYTLYPTSPHFLFLKVGPERRGILADGGE